MDAHLPVIPFEKSNKTIFRLFRMRDKTSFMVKTVQVSQNIVIEEPLNLSDDAESAK